MGWPFDEASWNNVEGAYYSAVGSEMIWFLITVVICLVALFSGAKHELDAYKREEDRAGK
ncbi:MAG: hypothetical protein AAGH68_14495 [Pseudomonadota bacterium]